MSDKKIDRKISKISDEVDELRKIIKDMRRELDRVAESFEIFKDVILQLEKEKEKFRIEKDKIKGRYDEFAELMNIGKSPKKIIGEGISKAVKNFDMIREYAKNEAAEILKTYEDSKKGKAEDKINETKKSRSNIPKRRSKKDFMMLIKNKTMKLNDAANKLGVHVLQVEAWSDVLKRDKLIKFYSEDEVGLTAKGRKFIDKKYLSK